MGTFCHDEYDHPLLWCDDKKRFVARKDADESLSLWRQKRVAENIQKENDKREIYDLNNSHCPWGKPGGGAPNLDIRRRDITASGLHSTPGIKIIPGLRSSAFPSCRTSFDAGRSFGAGVGGSTDTNRSRSKSISRMHHCLPPPTTSYGANSAANAVCDNDNGEQILSAADRLYITLKDHPSMTFRNKGHVDIELRYKTLPKGKKMLEKIVVTEQEKSPQTQLPPANAVAKRIGQKEDPWGKPGPGGKPWRNQKKVGSSFMRSLGWTNKELLKELDIENPTQKLVTKGPIKTKPPELKRCCELCTCKCPAMNSTKAITTESSPKKSPGMDKKKISISTTKDVTTIDKKTVTTKPKNLYGQKEMSEQKICPRYLRNYIQTTNTNQGVELVPLLARRRGLNRPISLSSTDVTKRTPEQRWTKYDVDYLNDLAIQMSQNRRRNNITNFHERELCNTHFDTFDTFWGRPGHGAPKSDLIKSFNKLNLDDLLYGVVL